MECYFVYIKCVGLTTASLQDDIGISDFRKYLDSVFNLFPEITEKIRNFMKL